MAGFLLGNTSRGAFPFTGWWRAGGAGEGRIFIVDLHVPANGGGRGREMVDLLSVLKIDKIASYKHILF